MPLTEGERIDYLIRTLESDNATIFAEKTGIFPSTISKIRRGKHGTYSLSNYIDRITKAYPQVDRNWLVSGEGNPGNLVKDPVIEGYKERLFRAERTIDLLIKEIEQKNRIIDRFLLSDDTEE